jgi:hypothetical protein
MKKLLILALIAFVAGGVFAQAAGPTVVFSGQSQYGVIVSPSTSDKTPLAGPGQYIYNMLRWDVSVTEFSKAVIRLRQRGATNSTTVSLPAIPGLAAAAQTLGTGPTFDIPNRAWLESDIAGELGLGKSGIKNTVYFGKRDHETADLSNVVSPFGVAMVDYVDLTGYGITNILNVMNMVNVRAIFNPDYWAGNKGGWAVSADAYVGPVAVNVMYTSDSNLDALANTVYAGMPTFITSRASDPAKGKFGIGARFSQEVAKDIPLAVYGGFAQNLYLEQWSWGAAVKVGYQTLATMQLGAMGFSKVKSGLTGAADDSMFSRMEARVIVMPISLFSLDLGTVLNIDQERYISAQTLEKSMLNEFDIRANLHANKATTISVGYLYMGQVGYYSQIGNELARLGQGVSSQPQGGVYFEAKLVF